MNSRKVKILGTGEYVPQMGMTSEELDRKLGVPEGWVFKKTTTQVRYYVEEGETASQMGAMAAQKALENAGLRFEEIDCLVSTSGTSEQAIPCTAALIQKALGQEYSGVPAFDIDSTCLSFFVGLDVMSYLVSSGRYRRILLVATEVASVGLNWSDKESASLFGDGAAAVVIGQAEEGESSRIVASSMETYSAGAEFSQIRGGGTRLHPRHTRELEPFFFEMDGKAIYRMAAKHLPKLVDSLLLSASYRMEDMKVVVPHQASAMALRLIAKKLGISDEQLINISPTRGNTIAASIPMGLHAAIQQKRIKRGDPILLVGTSAGLSLGGMILVY